MRECRTSGSVRGVPSNGHPYRNPWMMPLMIRRSSLRCAPGWFFGNNGSMAAHCRSSSQNSPAMIQAPEVSSLNHGSFLASIT